MNGVPALPAAAPVAAQATSALVGTRKLDATPGDTPEAKAGFIMDAKKKSADWMQSAFYPEWEQVYRNYKCLSAEQIKRLKADGQQYVVDASGKPWSGSGCCDTDDEPEKFQVSMPDTWAAVRRTVSRVTAAMPALKFRADDSAAAQLISTKVMWDWDHGQVQRLQKKHVLQCVLFGWSVRPWYWRVDEFDRTKRINPFRTRGQEEQQEMAEQIAETYGIPLEAAMDPAVVSQLMAKHSRGGMLPVKYTYRGFEGPATEFMFVGDCFPEPQFQEIQRSRWFIIERKRNLEWIKRTVKAYPELLPGFRRLLEKFPKGNLGTSSGSSFDSDTNTLRWRLASVVNQVADSYEVTGEENSWHMGEWLITECHYPGQNPRMAFVGEENLWIGEIPYPYELDGKVAFTEAILIDDLLSGIGDSSARIMSPLNKLHNLQTNMRFALTNHILRPLVGTSNRELYENPDLLKRYEGYRLVFSRPGDTWVIGEQAAIAAAAEGMNDEAALMRAIQMATGETNMSMSANVDPAQARTATGARLMAFNTDILSKDMQDMLIETSIKTDAEMMYLLNRSEMSESLEIDSARYERYGQSGKPPEEFTKDQVKWVQVTPEDFQVDAHVEVIANSVLADDDEANMQQAQQLWAVANQRPDLFNVEKARDTLLTAYGKGRELNQWQAPPPPPPPPPPGPKAGVNVSIKFETLTPELQDKIITEAFPEPPPPPEGMEGGGPPVEGEGMPPGGPGPGGTGLPGEEGGAASEPIGSLDNLGIGPDQYGFGEEGLEGGSAYQAARGLPLGEQ